MRTRQTILILCLFFLMGIFVAQLPARVAQLTGSTSRYDFFDPIIDVYSTISGSYVDRIDQAKLQLGAINGMLEALEDPYTQFVPPVDRADFHKELTGEFVGIGAEVVIEGGYLTIVSPLEDSPAYNAGVRPGDKVVEIDGESTLNLSIDECIDRLTGEPGTPVNILIARDGLAGERIPMTIIRQRIHPRAVRGVHRRIPTSPSASTEPTGAAAWEYTLDPERRIGYIRLSQFTPTAAEELAEALDLLGARKKGALGGLILDLRGNPGGVLDAALEIADMFLDGGVIASVKGREGARPISGIRDQVYSAHSAGTLPDFPLIVLVNGASASASEIVAGALADHDRAVVLGTRTFGKGLVQAVQTLRSPVWGGALGAQLKFTSQRYYLPSGRMIHRTDDSDAWGVDPTPGFYVPMTGEEQLARMLQRRDRDVLDVPVLAPGAALPAAEPARWSDPDWIETELKDKQLAAAVRAMHSRLDTGVWTPISDIADAQAQLGSVSLAELRRLELGRERMLRDLERLERRIDALSAVAAGDGEDDRATDLWPDDAPVAGGRLDVYDKDGNKVTTLRITGENLERWLIDAGVQPLQPAAPDAEPAPSPSDN